MFKWLKDNFTRGEVKYQFIAPQGLGPDGWVKALFGQRRIVNR